MKRRRTAQELRTARGFYCQTQVADMLTIGHNRYRYMLATGFFPRPTRRLMGSQRKYYNQADVDAILATAFVEEEVA